MDGPTAPDGKTSPIFFDAILYPHRSLPPRGFIVLMLVLSVVSFVAGVSFVLLGAWPILGFFGLDVLLVYLAFRASYPTPPLHECVRLTDGTLPLQRVGQRAEGRRREVRAARRRGVLRGQGAAH